MINAFLEEHYESDLILHLKKLYASHTILSEADQLELKGYETEDYALLGIIGLLLNNKPRILLGRLQPYDQEIKQQCEAVSITENDLKTMADQYLDDDFSEESEFILRKVMLAYPKKRT
ncbi:MAG: hypothetical protein KDD32_09395 [Bacteroidetes bacterium]|nr:hypothetical protein [Bacteroidota bacterium]